MSRELRWPRHAPQLARTIAATVLLTAFSTIAGSAFAASARGLRGRTEEPSWVLPDSSLSPQNMGNVAVAAVSPPNLDDGLVPSIGWADPAHGVVLRLSDEYDPVRSRLPRPGITTPYPEDLAEKPPKVLPNNMRMTFDDIPLA